MLTTATSKSFYSKAGDLIRLRRILPEDAPLLVDIFEHMSSDSRYRRYNQPLDHVAPRRIWQEAQQIAQADPLKSPGLIAFVDDPSGKLFPIGAVRLVEIAPGEAEVAISIRDDFQNRGIGTALMRHMAFEARSLGYARMTASIRNDNPAIWNVFSRLPFRVERAVDGTLSDITIYLDELRDTAETDWQAPTGHNS